jgi:Regulator of chromosome condensation (RCC1) repeat
MPSRFRPTQVILAIALALSTASASRAQIAGDECSNAIAIGTGSIGPIDTATMTPSANPPADETCTFLAWNNSKDVWFRYFAAIPGKLSLDFCQSSYDTSVVVYQGGTCPAPTRIGCDDDGCPTATNYQSRIVDLPVAIGEVLIRVGGYAGTTGTLRFELSFKPADNLGYLFAIGNGPFGATTPPADLGYIKAVDGGASSFHALAVLANGSVRGWGSNTFGQTSPPFMNDAIAVATGSTFSVALRASGQIAVWPAGSAAPPATESTTIDIGAGESHGIALRANGTVFCWGSNTSGQSTVPPSLPACIDVDAESRYSLAVRADGLIASWGQAPTPPASDITNVIRVSAGGGSSFLFAGALRSDGTVACWGANNSGQCDVPAGLGGVVSIAAGFNHMLALRADGTIVSWGNNGFGERRIPSAAGPFAFVAAGSGNSFVISRGDCNSNGVFDGGEVSSLDCTGNGIPDCWDFEFGWAEDCNSNQTADECEKQLDIAVALGTFSPIGFGQPQTAVLADAAHAVSNVELTFRGRGDFSSALEYVTVTCGSLFSRQILAGTGDCVSNPPQIVLTLTPEQYNDGIGTDGVWRLNMTASSAVDAGLCPKGTWISLVVRYTAANSSDCDANGELDSCQIAAGSVPDTNGNGVPDACESAFDSCPTDIDGDQTTGAADLALLLGGWGSFDPNLDISGDGVVGAPDLALLLGSWGPCPVN